MTIKDCSRVDWTKSEPDWHVRTANNLLKKENIETLGDLNQNTATLGYRMAKTVSK